MPLIRTSNPGNKRSGRKQVPADYVEISFAA